MTKTRIKKILLRLTLIICLLIFFWMVYLLINNKTSWIDNQGYYIATRWKNDNITTIFKFLSSLCSVYFIIFVCALSFLFFKNKNKSWLILFNVALCLLLNQFCKHLFLRNRPIDINLIVEKGYSFPSGHSMVSLAFYGLFIYIVYKSNLNKFVKFLLIMLLSTIILLIGVSRIYLGVHYTSDVIAGFSLSLAYLLMYINLIYKKNVIK